MCLENDPITPKASCQMSDAGDEIKVDEAPVAEIDATTEAPKGKLSVEDALQVRRHDGIVCRYPD